MSAVRRYLAQADREAGDIVVCVLIAVALELELRTWITDAPRGSGLVTALAAALFAAPIAVRRRWPDLALVAGSAIAPAQALLGGHLGAANGVLLPPVLLAYGAGAWLPFRRSVVALVIAAVTLSGFTLTTPDPSSAGQLATDLAFTVLLFVAPWFVGRLAREPARRAKAFRDLATQVAAEGRERESAAVAHERARIGGELQDIIADSVSAMIIQAGGARGVIRTQPEIARESILAVEAAGREALADLRRLLGVLRKDDDPRALAPQPGLDQLAELIRSTQEGGLPCVLQYEGEPIALTPGVDLVGYRAIECGLLEAARAHCGAAIVIVRYAWDQLEIEVSGDAEIPGLEQRVAGVAQRIALYAGDMSADPSVADGFALSARLPLEVRALA